MTVHHDLARDAIGRASPANWGWIRWRRLLRHSGGSDRQYGARDPGHFSPTRLRPARLYADGVWRGGPVARGSPGARTGHPACSGTPQSGHSVRDGAAADRPAHRLRHNPFVRSRPESRTRHDGRVRHVGDPRRSVVPRRRYRRRKPAHQPHRGHALRRPELRTGPFRRRMEMDTLDRAGPTVSAAMHRAALHGFAAEDEPVQLVTFRVEATGVVPKACSLLAGCRRPIAMPATLWREPGRSGWRRPTRSRLARCMIANGCSPAMRSTGRRSSSWK